MIHKAMFQWLRQRPWLLTPFLALIPLAGVYLNQRYSSQAQNAPISTSTPATASPVAKASPLPAPPSIVRSSQSPTAKPSPAPVDPKKYTKEQAAINEKSKAAFAAATGTVDSLIEMQVAIVMGANSVQIGGSQGATILDQNGRSLSTLGAGNGYTLQATGNGFTLNNQALPASIMIQPNSGGVLFVGDKPYRGQFFVAAQNGRLWVVNYIDLRHYLYSVVASEVSPSWNAEALKAQAVAARSYAMTYYFRRANPLYHMGSDEYFQVYSGMGREDDRSNKAVDETAGEFVSYRGGIVESLYAASDDIVADAFRGKGMSQLGALNLAEHGYTYRQILAAYYPKTGLARIEQDHE